MIGRKSKTFNPKRYRPEMIDTEDPHFEQVKDMDVRIMKIGSKETLQFVMIA